ncbi:uncharacterized protein [Chironomus tepperi]|uniref:uncharacterized protein n=1 Tax=Chironomus tepperi TaxID=113505 RepID=UPI00391FBE3F
MNKMHEDVTDQFDEQFKNLTIKLTKDYINFKTVPKKYLATELELKNLNVTNFTEINDILKPYSMLNCLSFINCNIEATSHEALDVKPTLRSVTLKKCSNNIYRILRNQRTIEKITIINHDLAWNGFYHDGLIEILTKNNNLKHLVLDGPGTGSFLDGDDFPFSIEKLDTTMSTFHWYVGLKDPRINFLRSQKGSLKELTIHELPYDFDGGKVLKYIIEEMKLDNFYYRKISLILNGHKQDVKEVEANEIQISSLYEMFRQYPSIEKLTFNLNTTDISSEDIERVINHPTNLFSNLKEVKVIDKSNFRGTLGVFIGLFKNFRNIQVFEIDSNDRNLETILGECLPKLKRLEVFRLSSVKESIKKFNLRIK